MSYHGTSTTSTTSTASAARSTTNAQGQTAPAGYHYMPNGVLMADSAHGGYGSAKVIQSFNLDTSDVKVTGEARRLRILGSNGAVFSLEIRNGASYYNFQSNLFQATQTKLNNISITGGVYDKDINFPNNKTTDIVNGAVTSGIKVVMDTAVANTMEVGDRVTGNAALNAANVTVAALDPDGDNANEFSLSEAIAILDNETLSFSGADQYDFYLTTGEGTKHSRYNEVRFEDGSVDVNSTTGSNSNMIQKVIYQTLPVTITINGYSPNGTITGANTTPATITTNRNGSVGEIPFSHTFTVTSTRTLSKIKKPSIKDITAFISVIVGDNPLDIPGENIYPTVTAEGEFLSAAGLINVAVSNSTTVTIDSLTATPIVGDAFEIINAPNSESPQIVTAVGSGNITSSVAISADNDKRIEFRSQRYHRWPISSTTVDVSKITPGMIHPKGEHFTKTAMVGNYLEQIAGVDKVRISAIETLGKKPLLARDATTKVITRTIGAASNPINVTFNQQALKSFGGTTAEVFGYGRDEINRLTGYDIELRGLNVTLTKVSTITTAAVNSSTSVPVAQRAGIMDAISSVRGIGINPNAAAPTVASGAGSVVGAGTIVLSAAQTLENGVELTFPGAGTVATISGKIKVNRAGNEDVTLRFDLEKFLAMH